MISDENVPPSNRIISNQKQKVANHDKQRQTPTTSSLLVRERVAHSPERRNISSTSITNTTDDADNSNFGVLLSAVAQVDPIQAQSARRQALFSMGECSSSNILTSSVSLATVESSSSAVAQSEENNMNHDNQTNQTSSSTIRSHVENSQNDQPINTTLNSLTGLGSINGPLVGVGNLDEVDNPVDEENGDNSQRDEDVASQNGDVMEQTVQIGMYSEIQRQQLNEYCLRTAEIERVTAEMTLQLPRLTDLNDVMPM